MHQFLMMLSLIFGIHHCDNDHLPNPMSSSDSSDSSFFSSFFSSVISNKTQQWSNTLTKITISYTRYTSTSERNTFSYTIDTWEPSLLKFKYYSWALKCNTTVFLPVATVMLYLWQATGLQCTCTEIFKSVRSVGFKKKSLVQQEITVYFIVWSDKTCWTSNMC